MQLRLQLINKIKKADITLKGLTVIAGANDTGKSTVGKVLFTIIKALNNVMGYDENIRLRDLKRKFILLRSAMRGLTTEEQSALQDALGIHSQEIDVQIESLSEKLSDISGLDEVLA